MRPRVIVTRPAREAPRWVDALRAGGFDARALPLIAIEPVEDAVARAALDRARHAVAERDAVMFVSAAAVEHFFASAPAENFLAPAPVGGAAIGGAHDGAPRRCWATGPGTVRALRRAGLPEACIDAPAGEAATFDSETLWALVRAQVGAGTRVLIVRGGDARARPTGRDWLLREIEGAGGVVDTVVAYRRLEPRLDDAARALATAASADGSVWLFSSSEAVAHLSQALPGADWGAARAVATHARIAQAAREAGFGRVGLASPRLDDLVASIESLG
jgi:uroporphyrinogen-III synthase